MAKIPITCQRRSPQITTVSEVTGSGFFLGGSVVAWERGRRKKKKKEKCGLRFARVPKTVRKMPIAQEMVDPSLQPPPSNLEIFEE